MSSHAVAHVHSLVDFVTELSLKGLNGGGFDSLLRMLSYMRTKIN